MATERPTTGVSPSAYGCITLPFLLLTCLTLGWGARVNWIRGDLLRNGTVVPGRVTELRFVQENTAVITQGTRGGSGRGQSPVVNFTTTAGEAATAVGSVNRAPAPWAVGDSVDIVYDPSAPTRADLVSEVSGWRRWFAIWCAVALVPLAIAALPVVFALRGRRQPGA